MTCIDWPDSDHVGRAQLHVLRNYEQLCVKVDPSPERLLVVQTMLRFSLQLLALELSKQTPAAGVLGALWADVDRLGCTVGTLFDELEPAA